MTSMQPGQWHDLYVAVTGASAALTGLIFVAVSLNLDKILGYPGLPRRAVETLWVMTEVLVISVFVLVPGQSRQALGVELLAISVLGTVLIVQRLRMPRKKDDPIIWTALPLTAVVATTLPLYAAGISLLAGGGGGLYWLVGEIVFAIIGVITNAWVLLVEIAR
jgi:hypothetical protein